MKERPILMNGAMVRAVLNGSKTQTRRIVKYQPPGDEFIRTGLYHPTIVDFRGEMQPGHEVFGAYTQDGEWSLKCPHGEPGDQLWVRETFSAMGDKDMHAAKIYYRADHDDGGRWTPSIHMPRWASRIQLEITSVRVERLNEISEADAKAEGTTPSRVGSDLDHLKYRAGFQTLWESINGADSWDANPWVWCISFQKVKQ